MTNKHYTPEEIYGYLLGPCDNLEPFRIIRQLQKEQEAMRRDIEKYAAISAEQATENEWPVACGMLDKIINKLREGK